MGVHLDESESAVGLEARLNNIAEVLEKGNEIVLGSVRSQVADVAGRLPSGGLGDDHVVTVNTVGREVVVPVRSSGSKTHLLHGLLLGNGRLTLLVGPVATNGPGSKPLSVHGAQSLLSIGTVAESNEAVTARATGLHVPHDAGLGNRSKGREGLKQHLVVDFIGQISDEDVEVTRGVLLVLVVGLVGPVHADFLHGFRWSALPLRIMVKGIEYKLTD